MSLLLRIELFTEGSCVNVRWRPFLSAEHGVLCRAAGLDPVRHYFEVPESFKRVGANIASFNGRSIDGFIFRTGVDRPVGKVSIAREGERFRDDDPRSRADFERL